MASDIEIVNAALTMLGDDPISSFTDNTARARLANALYQPTVDSVLRAHPWGCAVSRAILSQISSNPIFGWDFQFTLPTDPYCLRVLGMNDDQESGDPGDPYRIEGRKLLSNVGTANIRFIGRVTDPNLYDSGLYQAISFLMAAKMAYPITNSQAMAQEMWALYQGQLKEARTDDSQEGSPDNFSVTTLLDVRNV